MEVVVPTISHNIPNDRVIEIVNLPPRTGIIGGHTTMRIQNTVTGDALFVEVPRKHDPGASAAIFVLGYSGISAYPYPTWNPLKPGDRQETYFWNGKRWHLQLMAAGSSSPKRYLSLRVRTGHNDKVVTFQEIQNGVECDPSIFYVSRADILDFVGGRIDAPVLYERAHAHLAERCIALARSAKNKGDALEAHSNVEVWYSERLQEAREVIRQMRRTGVELCDKVFAARKSRRGADQEVRRAREAHEYAMGIRRPTHGMNKGRPVGTSEFFDLMPGLRDAMKPAETGGHVIASN